MNLEPDYYLKGMKKCNYYNTYNHINKISKKKKENNNRNIKDSDEFDITPFIKINNELLKLKEDINKSKDKKNYFIKNDSEGKKKKANKNFKKSNFQNRNNCNGKFKFIEFQKQLEILNSTIKNKNKQLILFDNSIESNKAKKNSNQNYKIIYENNNINKDDNPNKNKDTLYKNNGIKSIFKVNNASIKDNNNNHKGNISN